MNSTLIVDDSKTDDACDRLGGLVDGGESVNGCPADDPQDGDVSL
jgi:hypothetical protein